MPPRMHEDRGVFEELDQFLRTLGLDDAVLFESVHDILSILVVDGPEALLVEELDRVEVGIHIQHHAFVLLHLLHVIVQDVQQSLHKTAQQKLLNGEAGFASRGSASTVVICKARFGIKNW